MALPAHPQQEHPCPKHNIVLVARACVPQSIHAQTIITFLQSEKTADGNFFTSALCPDAEHRGKCVSVNQQTGEVGTQTQEELISERQCRAVLHQSEESMHCLLEQMDSLQERLAIQDLRQRQCLLNPKK